MKFMLAKFVARMKISRHQSGRADIRIGWDALRWLKAMAGKWKFSPSTELK
jgi:hypothetical protein